MQERKRRYIFISHAWDFNEYESIKRFLDQTQDFIYTDLSVPVTKPLQRMKQSKLKKSLEWRIRFSQIILVPAGMEVNHRKFIQYELETARRMDKPIVGIVPRGMRRVPKIITDSAWEIVGWSGKSIAASIERNVL